MVRVPSCLLPTASCLFFVACIGRPADADQIRAVMRDGVAAVGRGDAGAAYRLTDLDFRSLCSRRRFAAVAGAALGITDAERVTAVERIDVRGGRATAEVTFDGPAGARRERRAFVKEGGRWYLYVDAGACGVPAT